MARTKKNRKEVTSCIVVKLQWVTLLKCDIGAAPDYGGVESNVFPHAHKSCY